MWISVTGGSLEHVCVCSCAYLLDVMLFSVNVHMPRDRITQLHQNYGFVEFMGEDDADYAIKIMNMIKIYGKPIRVNKVGEITSSVLYRGWGALRYLTQSSRLPPPLPPPKALLDLSYYSRTPLI